MRVAHGTRWASSGRLCRGLAKELGTRTYPIVDTLHVAFFSCINEHDILVQGMLRQRMKNGRFPGRLNLIGFRVHDEPPGCPSWHVRLWGYADALIRRWRILERLFKRWINACERHTRVTHLDHQRRRRSRQHRRDRAHGPMHMANVP